MSSRPSLPRKPSDYRRDESNGYPAANPNASHQSHSQYPQDGFYSSDYYHQNQSQSQNQNQLNQSQTGYPSNYTSAADYYHYSHENQRMAAHQPQPQQQSNDSYDSSTKSSYSHNLAPNQQSNDQQRPMSLGGIISMYANSEDGQTDSSPNLDNGYQSHPATFPQSQPQLDHQNHQQLNHISPVNKEHFHQGAESVAGQSGGRTSRPLPPPPSALSQEAHPQGPSPSYYQSPSYQFPPDSGGSISHSSSSSSNLSGNANGSFNNSQEHYGRFSESSFSNGIGLDGRVTQANGYEYGHNPKQDSGGSFGQPATPSQGSSVRTSGNAPAWSPALSSSSLPQGSSFFSRMNPSPSPSRAVDGMPERATQWNEDQSEILGEDRGSAGRPYYGRTSSSSSVNRRRTEVNGLAHDSQSSKGPHPISNRPPVPLIIPPVQDAWNPNHQAGPLSPRSQRMDDQRRGDSYHHTSPPSPGRGEWSRDPSPRADPPIPLSGPPSRNATPTIASDGIERDQYGYPIDRKTPRYVDVHSRTDSGNQSAGLLSPTMSPTSRTFSGSSNHNYTSTTSYNPISQIPPAPSRKSQSQDHNGSTPVEYVDFSLLSNLAVLLRDAVPRGEQIKGSIAYPGSFTGRDVVSTLQGLIPKELAADSMGIGNELRSGKLQNWDDGIGSEQNNRSRRVALLVARSLKKQLFFHEVDWGEGELNDGVEDVYMFLGDTLGGDEVSHREQHNTTSSSSTGSFHQVSTSSGPHGQRKDDPFCDDWTSPLESSGPLDLGLILPQNHSSHSNSASDLDELPTGVFTPLTNCYSPLCGKPNSPFECYSPSCPRSQISPLKRHISSASASTSNAISPPSLSASNSFTTGSGSGTGATTPTHHESRMNSRAWVEMVPPELLNSLPKKEIDRQNAIHETIQKEEEYLADIELLEDLFVQGMLKPNEAGDPPPIAIGPARDAFVAEVFSNHRVLAAHIRRLVERLHVRQREECPIIQSIGDIFLDAALEWAEVYEANMINFPLAKSRVRREMQVNPRFAEFVETCRRHPLAHRHDLDNFLYRPTARLQRYHLHFEAILKKTEDNNSDKESLTRAMEVIDHQCKTAQIGVASSEIKVKIREYAWGLTTKRNKAAIDMDLLHPERQLVHQGRVLRKPDFTDFEWTDLLAVLFDNYLIVVKPKKVEQGDRKSARYILAKRPIPVEMMELSGFNDASVSRSIGLSNFHIRERDNRDLWPFTVHHIGGKLEPLTLFAVSKEDRDEWKRKLDEAIGLRSAVQEANKVFESHTLSDNIFALPSAGSIDPDKPPHGVDPSVFHGKVTCAVPFSTADNRRLVAIGCADGVWIGLRHDPRSLRKVLHLKLVSQCAVLEPFGIFVVLADKVLISYSLEALVPSANPNNQGSSSQSAPRPPQKLSGNRDVVFFSVGVLKERTLLVYMKRRANECVFRALEPVMNAPRADHGRSGGGLFGRFGKDSKNPDWFRIYKTFFIPSEAYTMQFLRSKLCIVCARGFEIMNLDSLLPGTIPDFSHCPRDDPRIQAIAKRVETAKPLGMFKSSESEFLLCYDGFACYVDRVGEPIRLDNIIEWEGEPQSVAFQAPYVLAFDSRFVEVRDSATGRLVQIIRGSDMRYVSGSSTVTSAASSRADGESSGSPEGVQDGTIIITQRKKANGRTPFDYQSVVELVSNAPQIIQNSHNHSLSQSNTISSSRAGWI